MVSESPSSPPNVASADSLGRSNVPVYSVSELSGALKRTVEQAYSYVRVRGEISGCKRHSSGHVYLCLKDMDAVIDGVCWRGSAAKLKVAPGDGIEVIATGRLTTYPGRSKYQLVIEQMELAGQGALLKMLEDRKRKLAAEGLFDDSRKRPLPFLPRVIGVVTSPTGAVIRDILHRLAERFPRHVLLWPVAVQGEGAAEQVARAIDGFNRIAPDAEGQSGPVPRPDLLIVARGGGSLEDLMAFNEEIVVRAAAASAIPLISAVGHETDTTLIDFASDRRAPTPTAAAEMAVPVRLDLLAALRGLGQRLDAGSARLLGERRLHLQGLARGLPEPIRLIEAASQRLDDRAERFELAASTSLANRRAAVATLAARLPHPRQQLESHIRHLGSEAARLRPSLDRFLAMRTERLDDLARRHRAAPVEAGLQREARRLRDLAHRLDALKPRVTAPAVDRLARLGQVLESLSPYRVLERGYAVVGDDRDRWIDPAAIEPGMALTLRFAGERRIAARAEGEAISASEPRPPESKPAESKPARPAKSKPAPAEQQPSLFDK